MILCADLSNFFHVSYFCHRITQARKIQGKHAGNLCKLQKKIWGSSAVQQICTAPVMLRAAAGGGRKAAAALENGLQNTLETQKFPLRSSNRRQMTPGRAFL